MQEAGKEPVDEKKDQEEASYCWGVKPHVNMLQFDVVYIELFWTKKAALKWIELCGWGKKAYTMELYKINGSKERDEEFHPSQQTDSGEDYDDDQEETDSGDEKKT